MDEMNVATNPEEATPAVPNADTKSATDKEGAAPTAEPPTAPTVDKTIRYKYNHADEVLDLSKEEDAQKAAEYLREGRYFLEKGKEKLAELDRTKEELATLQNDEGRRFLMDAAKRMGITYPELVARMKSDDIKKQDAAKAAATKKPLEVVQAERLAEDAERRAKEAETKLTEKEQKEAADVKFAEEMREFAREHPDIEKLPEEVSEMVQEGLSIKKAYALYEKSAKRIRELEEQAKVKETNDSNAAASMGPVGSGDTGRQGKLTQDDVLKMSPAEIEKLDPKTLHELFFKGD
jgi:hypothetical protein